MKSILILLSVFTVFGTQAQSKKDINYQLKDELSGLKFTYDAFLRNHFANQREIVRLKENVLSLEQYLKTLKSDESNYRSNIHVVHAKLFSLGFDANTILALSQVDTLVSPAVSLKLPEKSGDYDRKFNLIQVSEIADLTNLKLKDQNELLRVKIYEMKAVNAKNTKLLADEQSFLKQIGNLRDETITIVSSYEDFNHLLYKKYWILQSKYVELQNAKAADFANNYPVNNEFVSGVTINRSGESEPPTMPLPIIEEAPVIMEVVEHPAEFVGGREAMVQYLQSNIRVPEKALTQGIGGKVYLRFVVSTTGNVSNVTIKKGIADCPECDDEAARVVRNMPDWIPAENEGKVVNCWYTLPIVFNVRKK